MVVQLQLVAHYVMLLIYRNNSRQFHFFFLVVLDNFEWCLDYLFFCTNLNRLTCSNDTSSEKEICSDLLSHTYSTDSN